METAIVKNSTLNKFILIASLLSAAFFAVAFSHIVYTTQSVVLIGLFELITLPMIALQLLIIGNAVRHLFVGKRRLRLMQLVPLLIALAILVGVFTVK